MKKEIYFLAKDPTQDRLLIHKVSFDEGNLSSLKVEGYCATVPNDPESDYSAVMKIVNTYRDSFDSDPDGERFYEGFSLWVIDYFEKHWLPMNTPIFELGATLPSGAIKKYQWKREGEKIVRVEI